MSESRSNEFKARIGREIPANGKTRVVFSIRTARGNRLELDGTFDEDVVLEAWKQLNANIAKQGAASDSAEGVGNVDA